LLSLRRSKIRLETLLLPLVRGDLVFKAGDFPPRFAAGLPGNDCGASHDQERYESDDTGGGGSGEK
jgi:hypothetical protein